MLLGLTRLVHSGRSRVLYIHITDLYVYVRGDARGPRDARLCERFPQDRKRQDFGRGLLGRCVMDSVRNGLRPFNYSLDRASRVFYGKPGSSRSASDGSRQHVSRAANTPTASTRRGEGTDFPPRSRFDYGVESLRRHFRPIFFFFLLNVHP